MSVTSTFLTEATEILLDKRPELVERADSFENNALHYAAQTNNPRMVDTLLSVRSGLAYKKNGEGQSPLHVAVIYGSVDAIRAIIKICTDATELRDSRGWNALHTAVVWHKAKALKCVLQHVHPSDMVNRVDNDGNTPLHLAAVHARVQCALLLLEDARVNPCVLNRKGQTARSAIEEQEDANSYQVM